MAFDPADPDQPKERTMSLQTFPVRSGLPSTDLRPAAKTAENKGIFAARLDQILPAPQGSGSGPSQADLEARLLALTLNRGLLDEYSDSGRDYFPSLLRQVRPSLPAPGGPPPRSRNSHGGNGFRTYDRTGKAPSLIESDKGFETAAVQAPSPSQCPPSATPLEDIINRASERFGVEPQLIRAVIQTESSFRPNVVSPVGAQGLMQLMPATARDLGVANPFDPEQNVMGGTRYLRQLLDRFDGDLDRALAAYNWGMGNVERRGMDRMPRETRDYLVKVKEAVRLS